MTDTTFMPSFTRRTTLAVLLATAALALTACSSSGHGLVTCPRIHTVHGDYVPAGPRPCLLTDPMPSRTLTSNSKTTKTYGRTSSGRKTKSSVKSSSSRPKSFTTRRR